MGVWSDGSVELWDISVERWECGLMGAWSDEVWSDEVWSEGMEVWSDGSME